MLRRKKFLRGVALLILTFFTFSMMCAAGSSTCSNGGSVKSYAQISLQSKTERSQPAKEASSHAPSKCFMFIYFLLPH